MDNRVFQVPCVLNKYESKANKTVKLTFTTVDNVPPELLAPLLSWIDNAGFLSFAIRQIEIEDIKDLPQINPSKSPEVKSKSLLIRQVIYKLHMQNGGTKEAFVEFYNKTMDKFIKLVTDKLEE